MQAELFPHPPGKGEQARRRLLLSALEKIGEKGYENASVREIADAAGQNLAAISYYFGSKEKLYAEVLDGIGAFLRSLIGPLAEESRRKLEEGALNPAGAVAVLKQVLGLLLGKQLGASEFDKIRLVMMREQAAPSESFDILYQNSLKPLHQTFCRLLAVATGEEPESTNVILRAHAIFGQVLVFTICRSTILRRLEIDHFEPQHVSTIAAIIEQHLDRLCGPGPFPSPLS
ncbi:CerR family C-terminal domain-containing protein [Luteolibacter ambystomatis]|uniref:CerR family C-terminal domain-containing protein n=1 Tax=Luteolibacter ambystomatis TaxID=2824561 RepID=A0A975G768_9BACT|nr:CerR family C-terminal domain-containing protein [Luteolibacter ambystomatis]QUE50063.1 CerR family C-terminal domain-containing protein [Luteolibacter ambystomatis]